MNNQKQANINVTIKDFFFKWVNLTKPFHKLAKQKQDVLSLLLYYHYMYRKEITNKKILWKMIFDYDTKKLIKEELNLKDQGLQNVLSILRKEGVIKDNKIINLFIPKIDSDSNNFKIIFNFTIVDG